MNQNTVGIDESRLTNKANIFPVPSQGLLNINASSKISSYVVTDLQGKEIRSQKVNTENFAIDIQDVQNGTYILKLIYTSGKIEVRKILKQ